MIDLEGISPKNPSASGFSNDPGGCWFVGLQQSRPGGWRRDVTFPLDEIPSLSVFGTPTK